MAYQRLLASWPGGKDDPFRDTVLNGHLLALVDADIRHRAKHTPAQAIALEARRAFASFPRPCWQQRRILECLAQLGVDKDQARLLWRERE